MLCSGFLQSRAANARENILYNEELGRAYALDGQSDRAIEEYRVALLRDPTAISTRLALADEYMRRSYFVLADFELTQALKQQPDLTEAVVRRGLLYFSAHLYSKAKSLFLSLSVVPKHQSEKMTWALFYMANLEKNFELAEQYLNQIKETSENQFELLYQKANLAKNLNQKVRYADLLRLSYKKNPNDPRIVLQLQDLLEQSGQTEEALIILQRYSDTHAVNIEVSQNLVRGLVKSGNYEKALFELQKMRPYANDVMTVDLQNAHVRFLAGDFIESEQVYRGLLNQRPGWDQAQFYLAQLYLAQGQLNRGRSILSEIELQSSDFIYPEAQVQLAQLDAEEEGDFSSALQRLQKAEAKRPDYFAIYNFQAELYLQKRLYPDAVNVIAAGLRYFPDNEELLLKLAFAYNRLKKFEQFKATVNKLKGTNTNFDDSELNALLAENRFLRRSNPKNIEDLARKALAQILERKKPLSIKASESNANLLLAWSLVEQDRAPLALGLFEKFHKEDPEQPVFVEAIAHIYRLADAHLKAAEMQKLASELRRKKNAYRWLRLFSADDSKRYPVGSFEKSELSDMFRPFYGK